MFDNQFDAIFSFDDVRDGRKPISIVHGDYWINNMMFQYDADNRPVDIKMVDWQISKLAHPSRDVVYFLYSCSTSETRKNHLDHLLSHYFTTLTSSLQLLGVDPDEAGSYDDFLDVMKDNFLWAMFISFLLLPLILDNTFANSLQDDKGKCSVRNVE